MIASREAAACSWGLTGWHAIITFYFPRTERTFAYWLGTTLLRVFAKRIRDREPRQLAELRLRISDSQARELEHASAGIYSDWGPDQQAYHPHVERKKLPPMPKWLFDAATQLGPDAKAD